MTDVGLIGSGPAIETVEATLTDVGLATRDAGPAALADGPGVVVAPAGHGRFDRATDAAVSPWIAVELGGIGGYGGPAAAVTGLAPDGPCYRCLERRVAANATTETEVTESDTPTARVAGAIAGRAAVALVAGEGSPVGTVTELPHADRTLLPVPTCGCGDGHVVGADPGALDADKSVRLDAAVERAERALDDRIGLLSTVAEAESFPVPYYLATVSDTGGFSDATAPRQAAGVAEDWNAALMKALGEGIERYAAAIYREATLTTGPADSVPGAVAPGRFVAEPRGDRWVPGMDLATGERVHLPAGAVVFPPPDGGGITTGLGLGTDGTGAIRAGVTEVIERDATICSWYSTAEPLGLTVDDERFATLTGRARSEGLAVTPLLVTVDVDVPVVAVAVHRGTEWPQFAVGSDAALDATEAAVGALCEALQNWTELRSMGPEEAGGAIGRYATFPEPVRSFVDPERTVPAPAVSADIEDGEGPVAAIVDRLAAADLSAYVTRLTPRDVAAAGFEAVRVVVPEAQPLFTGEPTFGGRVETVARDRGYEPRLDGPDHPYP
ncbi:bacteriocin biosynthesis protein SagD [Halobacteriales archaeon SW_7_68_16]|nr:MAG: bacteriocin biosynthesis protein SagD [Halobacteriales archaeon SW_7_68_16]